LQLDCTNGKLVESQKAALFLRGPIPLNWLGSAAALPGKTLHVGIALWWLHGMARGKPFKLTQKALQTLNVERDAAGAALARLEKAGLIRVVRKPGQRPTVSVVEK
jgi:DNA-binding MarR family transcriptional regulator